MPPATLMPPAHHAPFPYERGDRVTIRDGMFADMEGQVDEVLPGTRRLRVVLTIFGRPVPVELEHWQITLRDPLTEAEWRTCTSLSKMEWCLCSQGRTLSCRRRRLFAAACAGHAGRLLKDPRFRQALAVSRRHADGQAGPVELAATREAVARAIEETYWNSRSVSLVAAGRAVQAVLEGWEGVAALAAQADPREVLWQGEAFRDVAGNPFRPTIIDPAWLRWQDGCVVRMARNIYEDRLFDDLPILADALEEAGCADLEILAHCRSSPVHIRGCWVLDGLLGRT
jgi:hypothetical protein